MFQAKRFKTNYIIMKKESIIPLIVLMLITLFVMQANAQLQNVTATSGGNFTGSVYAVSFTVGEPVINTLLQGNVMVTQGFHQPHLTVTALDEAKGVALNIKAWPNPTTHFVQLEISNELTRGSSFQLFSMSGSLIKENKLEGTITEISFQNMKSATYLLRVIQNNQTLRTFKIIKK